MFRPQTFPFAAVAGMDRAKEALLLLAIDPGLKGVLIDGGPGTAKSLLARAFRTLLVPHDGCERPFVEVPLGTTEDRLLGGLHLEATILSGRRQMQDGLLARAHRGLIFVDGINLLDPNLTRHVVQAINGGVIRVEREGLSSLAPSALALIGVYDHQDGNVGHPLLDAVGMHVVESECAPLRDRVDVMQRVAAFSLDPEGFTAKYASETAATQARIAEARRRLPCVKVDDDSRRKLSLAAIALGVEGHRGDVFAARLACAHAALKGRARVREEDLKRAVEFVLLPRAAVMPRKRHPARPESSGPSRETTQPPPDAAGAPRGLEDVIIRALDGDAPAELVDLLFRKRLENGSADVGRRRMAASDKPNWTRGRYTRAVAFRPPAGKLAIDATLRAAAPHQALRRQTAARGARPAYVLIGPDDLRFKQFRQKEGALVIFAVDASGSMALNRINQAKGALLRLLRESYLRRDKVALIGFRRDAAEIVLPPSRSVDLARRAIDMLPVGGGTPLAAGLHAALSLATRARSVGLGRAVLVLFTDGRPNLALGEGKPRNQEAIWSELRQLGEMLRSESIASVVIDTRVRYAAGGGGERLAEFLGARRVVLPELDAEAVCQAVRAAMVDS